MEFLFPPNCSRNNTQADIKFFCLVFQTRDYIDSARSKERKGEQRKAKEVTWPLLPRRLDIYQVGPRQKFSVRFDGNILELQPGAGTMLIFSSPCTRVTQHQLVCCRTQRNHTGSEKMSSLHTKYTLLGNRKLLNCTSLRKSVLYRLWWGGVGYGKAGAGQMGELKRAQPKHQCSLDTRKGRYQCRGKLWMRQNKKRCR